MNNINKIVLELCNEIKKNNICHNFPVYNNYDLGDGNEFFKKYFMIYVNEYSCDIVLSYILFQIYTALFSLQKYFNITHHNLILNNLLFKSTLDLKDEYIMYTIDGNNYYIQNLGFIIVISNFEFAFAPNRIFIEQNDYYTNLNAGLQSINEDMIQIPRLSVDYRLVTKKIYEVVNKCCLDNDTELLFFNTFRGFLNGLAINDIIKYYHKYYSKRQIYIYKYSLDKFLKPSEEIAYFLRVNKFKEELKTIYPETMMRLQYIKDNKCISIPFPHYENYFN